MRSVPSTSFCGVAVFFALALFFPVSAQAWDAEGHELIATMANARLNPKARQAVSELAAEMQNPAQTYDAITIACWMDDLRNDPAMPFHGMFLSWHYIDNGIDPRDPRQSLEPGDDNEVHGNAVQGMKRALVVLKGGIDPYVKSKAMACALLVHLVGDIHQPLHCATKYFYFHGQLHQDAGGNKEGVINGPAGDEKFNLHAFWDSAWRASFDDASGRIVLDARYQEHGRHDAHDVGDLAAELGALPLPPGTNLAADFDAWAHEGTTLARDFVYRDLTDTESKKYCRLSSGYVEKARQIARERLVLAAGRLATLLNATLGADTSLPVPPSYPAGPPSQAY